MKNQTQKITMTLAIMLIASASAWAAPEKTVSDYLAQAWERVYYAPFIGEISQVKSIPPASAEEQFRCDHFYSKVRAKGEMKIIMGIGYYDMSEGTPFGFDYREDGHMTLEHKDFGMNATVDITYEIMYRNILTERCHGHLQLCGFREEQPGVYAKDVRDPSTGRKVRAVIEIKNASVTPDYDANMSTYKDQQLAKSEATTKWFFGSIPESDLVVYNGHSRKGGGPDFFPPRLFKNLHVNYAWYNQNMPGVHNLLDALNAPTQPAALLLMSCNSYKLFTNRIGTVAPDVALATTNDIIPGNIPNKGAIAGMDSFLKFQCQDGFNQELQMDDDLKKELHPLTVK